MSIRFKCPSCSKSIKISMAHAGKKGKCPGCNQTLKMPSEEHLQKLMAKQAAAVGAAVPAQPAPVAEPKPAPASDDLFGDLGAGSFDDDDFNFPEPPAAEPEQTYNPYASPLSEESAAGSAEPSGAEATRKRLLSHEASIRSMGALFIIGGVLGCLAGIVNIVQGILAMMAGGDAAVGGGVLLVIGAVVGGLCAFQYWVGAGLRKCNPSARVPAIVLSAIGLLGFPIGTLINAYFLYLVAGKKGAEVLSSDYQRVIAATPHIKHKISIIVWIFVALLVAVLLLVLVAFAVG
ncbi:hypothetical protein KOR34_31070 [Posidoniimonas corsicana]|uniref:Uncharacterized protein n=1 Tax=Posidoniimonas corsicana TaxID=1938618 RepID=A0A5C5VJT1_9BACT|nr:hypothetical protein [Posidoniimonas corsicana]TWT38139.1 hypothetical protein KOR34_31070 [Posidoniimonas corsicana]